ncbi:MULTISPECIES: sulfatase [Sphingobacterium]|uniref:sulfatase n=1 Tax=Sphingobacterium TaxID=28453 RepID=UPI0013DB70A2|nr:MULTISPECIES: sulfatase [unclassified Sphingobacterium]
MKILYILFLLIVCCITQTDAQTAPPNIIVILVDDLGYKDVGFMGGNFYRTPHLDGLAKESIVYEQAYAAASNCAPSRASILTGLLPNRHGIYTVGSSERGKTEDRKLIPIKNNNILDNNLPTIATLLSRKGYQTAAIGKWHLSDSPLDHGFSNSFGGNHSGHNKYFSPYKNTTIPDGKAGEYLTDRITNEAIDYIGQQKETTPFFLYLSYYAVHTPLEAPDSLQNQYKGIKGTGERDYPVYAAMIESLDHNIGKLVAKLKHQGLLENTILWFCSDNGGINTISPQQPLRAGKGSYFEGGVRIPFFIHWPNQIQPCRDSSTLVSHLDLLPTIKEIVEDKSSLLLDGESLWNNIRGVDDLQDRVLFWHFPIYLEAYNPSKDDGRDPKFRTRPGSSIRSKNWKLHHYYEDDAYLLYNLSSDVGERINKASEYPDILKKMKSELKKKILDTNAKIPSQLNPNYKNEL